jgi:hypothetical protein
MRDVPAHAPSTAKVNSTTAMAFICKNQGGQGRNQRRAQQQPKGPKRKNVEKGWNALVTLYRGRSDRRFKHSFLILRG